MTKMFGLPKKKHDEESAKTSSSENEPKTRQTFSDLMRGLQYSVNAAQQVLERHHLYLLSKYIDENGEPKKLRIRLNEKKFVDLPLLAYMNQGALGIDELEIEFSAKIDASHVKAMPEKGAGTAEKDFSIDRSCFEMNFTPSSREGDLMHVRIKFKNREVPEGVARVTDELNKEIWPRALADGDAGTRAPSEI